MGNMIRRAMLCACLMAMLPGLWPVELQAASFQATPPDHTVPEQPAPENVLTDTPEYCLELSRRADAHRDASSYARELAATGRHLCEQGRVVAGIARLRRALMVMRHGSHAAP